MKIWVGIDDTDSREGMCTTYLATIAMERIEERGDRIVGLPRLVRLNPTVPFKTRGNGAVSFLVETNDVSEVLEIVREVIEELAMLKDANTHPGAVFVSEDLAIKLSYFADKAMKDLVTIDEALFIIGKYFIPHLKFKKGRGLIGALAAIGAELNDFVLELLTYRYPERFGTQRICNLEDFFEVDYVFYPKIFDTVDWCNNVVVALPGTPCPVLYGLRGENLESLYEAMKMIRSEPIDKFRVFITNHGTDMHIIDEKDVKELKNYRSYRLTGVVATEPYDIIGGHVFFEIETRFGLVKCAAFEPTKQLRNVIRKLKRGDLLEVYGSMKKDTLNLEKLNIVKLAEIKLEYNPKCPKCGKRMESAGRGQGYRCRSCKTKSFEKEILNVKRDIEEGFYEVPPSARRHLTKPLVRLDTTTKKHIFR
ncbi:MAG: tRNA(Ile)(2)-agmatinylcytidine synthase [Archaeoglobales archaeon]|nr:tRNA(Ile)(2)-agmatinylcytidine synthase [Archaeoglobales archaeon]